MSTDESDSPRFGRRSAQWTPDGSGSQSEVPSTKSTPWPQYGQLADDAATASSPPTFTGHPDPQGAHAPGPGRTYPGTSGIYGQNLPKLPSRKPAASVLILGIVITFVVSPLVFLSMVIGQTGIMDRAGTARTLTNGDTVTIDGSGAYYVVPSHVDVYSCTLTGTDQVAHQMEAVPVTVGFQIFDLPAGDYVITCEGEGSFTLEGMNFMSETDLVTVGASALGAGTLTGLAGIVIAVIGIVLLVRVNRRRRKVFAQVGLR